MSDLARRSSGGGRSRAHGTGAAHRAGAGGTSPRRPSGGTASVLAASTAARRRGGDAADHLPVRLLIGLIVATGVVALAWLMGAIGHRLGFAMAMRVPELDTGGTRALVTGIMLLVSVPRLVLEAGIRQPLWLLAGFLLLSVPAAGLAAAEPRRPGGPPPNPVYAAMANVGAIVAMLTAAGLLWWTGSPVRTQLMRPMPGVPSEAAAWPADLATAAGLDVLAVVAAALWLVLVFRLPIPGWLRALSASIGCFALVVVTVALSISGATASQVDAQRSAVRDLSPGRDATIPPVLLIGRSGDREAVLVSTGGRLEVELRDPPADLRVVGRASIAAVARDAAGG